MLRPWRNVAIIGVLLVLAIAVPRLGLPAFYVSLLTQTWIYGILAMSLDLLVGFTGLVSFMQAAFFGIGAYVVAIAATRYHFVDFWPTLVVAILLAAITAAAFGALALRAEDAGFIIITLALNEIVWGLAYQWVSMSGGDNGITGFLRVNVGPFHTTDNAGFYYLSLAALVVCLTLLVLMVRSPFGLVLVGTRERPRRMAALGYNVWLFRYLALIIAAMFAAVAGVLFAYYNEFVGPGSLSLDTTTQVLIMVILGGTGTLIGPLLGAGILVFLSNALSDITQRWVLILGAIYVVTVMYAPDGIVGLVKRLAARAQSRRELSLAASAPVTAASNPTRGPE
ncbi:MAG TPA: branched-chain amino acid ABC transporter permease [Candidatus Dormibacteraeota bacterium]|nr:branched-chain amino acid ABC transporter permease [Candidatus Dormibacteraeota bacterium]